MPVSVRAATRDDLDFLADSHRLAHDTIADARGGALDTQLHKLSEPLTESFGALLAADAVELLVGELDGTPVGYAVLQRKPLPDGTELGSIDGMWVHADARGVGVGAALMAEITVIATEWGCIGLDSRALPGDRVTKNFFESFGLKARAIHVHRALS